MSSPLEEQLRAAGRAVTQQVTYVPESRGAPARPEPARRPWAASGRRWSGWAVPVAAMVAVAAVAVGAVFAHNALDGRSGAPASGPSAEQLPLYYANANVGTGNVVWINNRKTLDTTIDRAPAGHIVTGVIGAGDNSIFVFDMPPKGNPDDHEFYITRPAKPGGIPRVKSRLTLTPSVSGDGILGLALSPDKSRLAVLFLPPDQKQESLRLYSMSTGKVERQWSMPAAPTTRVGLNDNDTALAWTNDGTTVEFRRDGMTTAREAGVPVYILNTILPGDNLWASSQIFTVDATAAACFYTVFTPDGKSVVCGSHVPPPASLSASSTAPVEITEYSTTTGLRTRLLFKWKHAGGVNMGGADVVWANDSGSAVLANVDVQLPGNGTPTTIDEKPGLFSSHGVTSVSQDYPIGAINLLVNGDVAVAF